MTGHLRNSTLTKGQGIKMWLAKFALSKGIKEVVGRPYRAHNYQEYVSVDGYAYLCVLGKDVFHSHKEAVSAAERMRADKIKSLKEQIAKLEKMKF